MNTVHILQHLHLLPSGERVLKQIGTFASRASAISAIERLQEQPDFREHPVLIEATAGTDLQGFYIDEYDIDQNCWGTGYEVFDR